MKLQFLFSGIISAQKFCEMVCVSLHSCACQMRSSANDVPSHAQQHLSCVLARGKELDGATRNRYRVCWLVAVKDVEMYSRGKKRSLQISCLLFAGRPPEVSPAHNTRNCKPCGFFWAGGGQKGQLCLHCHLCQHASGRKPRSEQTAEVFLLSPLFAPGLRCACVVHRPSFIA